MLPFYTVMQSGLLVQYLLRELLNQPHLHCPEDPEPEGLLLDLVEAAVMARLEHAHHQEAAQAHRPCDGERRGSNLVTQQQQQRRQQRVRAIRAHSAGQVVNIQLRYVAV